MDNENEDKNDKMNSLFNPLRAVGGIDRLHSQTAVLLS